MFDVRQIKEQLAPKPSAGAGLGFDRVEILPGSTFQESSTVVICPTLGMISHQVVGAWQNLMSPMNQKKAMLFAVGDEVGQAYDNTIRMVLAHPEFSKWKYILTMEDDNIPPADAHIRLVESIESGTKWDAVSGIYFTKGPFNMPMAYGDPESYRQTGVVDFRPRDIREALAAGKLMPVNGIGMGCALWRMELFRQISPPWFVTVADIVPEKGPVAFTQDLWFCKRAKELGKRFAVDLRVRVGHLDVTSGLVY